MINNNIYTQNKPQQPQPENKNIKSSVTPKQKTEGTSQEKTKQVNQAEATRYIPSPEPVKLNIQQTTNSAEADLALKSADEAEKRAIDILSGKFS